MKILISSLLVSATLLSTTGCEKREYGRIYDKSLLSSPPSCMKLNLFPNDEEIGKTLKRLYPFSEKCPYRLEVSYKDAIHCNSTQNVERKVNSNFPSAFLRFDLYKGMKPLYSYYKDLTHPPQEEDFEEALESLQRDLHLDR